MSVSMPLLELESSWLSRNDPAITTITYFSGNLEEAAPKIEQRFRAVVNANPWLAGRLAGNKQQKRMKLIYPGEALVTDDVFNELFHVNPQGLKLHSTMPYEMLAKASVSAIVQPARLIVNRPSLVTRLTLVADSRREASGFALIFSMSHNVGDGYSYYKILNMLSTACTIEALSAARKGEATPLMVEAMGKKEWGFFSSPAHAFNALRGIVFGKKAKAFAYYVDEEKISAVKASMMEEGNIPFVSTNDILTSSFSNFINARLSSMTVNFRNKIFGIDGGDAGNYRGVIFYDKEGYASPAMVRKSLQAGPPYVGVLNELPGFWESVFCDMGMITNWACFSEDLVFEGCEELLHLPLYDLTLLPYEAAIIFRPKSGALGVIYATKRFEHEQFTSSTLPIGELVSQDVFMP